MSGEPAATHLRVSFESAPVGLLLVGPDGTIVAANRRIESQFGYFRSDLVGQPIEILLPETVRERHVDYRNEYFRKPTPRTMGTGREFHGRRRDGSLFPVEIGLTPSDVGTEHLVIAAVADVSVRRDLQARAQQAERLSALGELTGAVAHDFNNLLTTILAPLDLSLQMIEGRDVDLDALREEIRVARDSAKRAAALTRHLLTFSRRRVFSPVPLGLNDVIEQSKPMLERLLVPTSLRFRLRPDLPAVLMDPGLFDQVLLNLMVNAGDATGRKGTIEVRTGTVMDEDRVAFRVTLEVADNGVGMSPETMARIFEPFFTTKAKGTGLGLATVYGIVTQAGGRIEVESEVGKGTTFRVVFPATSALPSLKDAAERLVAPRRERGNGEGVLVVDDEPRLREVACRVLERAGYRPVMAGDGRTAIETFRESSSRLGLAILDIGLPDMDGLDLADRLKEIDDSVPIAFTSGHSEEDVLHRFAARAPREFLEKPYSLDALIEMVNRAARAVPAVD